MGSTKNIEAYLKDLQRRLAKEMPKILKEIQVYEDKIASGNLTRNPAPGPQFNG